MEAILYRLQAMVFEDPNRLLFFGFAATILAGGVILWLPICQAGESFGLIDAMFMATSAVCLTGLVVVDTGSRLSGTGQAVLLALVQIGALGITVLSSAVFLVLQRRVSLSSAETVRGLFLSRSIPTVGVLLRRLLVFMLAVETIGAVMLFVQEVQRLPIGEAAWHAVFHSISAFCNAGFGLRPDNLMGDRLNPWMIMTMSALIVIGGLGFQAFFEGIAWLRQPRGAVGSPLSLNTRIVLSTTAILIVVGAVLFAILEQGNLLKDASWEDAVLTSVFASITPRTAGFNTIDYGAVTSATLYLTILLMLIGGSPGSTAGGIKTTTLAVLFAVARARQRGQSIPSLFHRSIPREAQAKAVTVFTIGALIVLVAAMLLSASEIGDTPAPSNTQWSLGILFECVSALGTVGLTTGITPQLSDAGKIMVIVLMFIGRLGPLTAAVALARRRQRVPVAYAEEQVMIG